MTIGQVKLSPNYLSDWPKTLSKGCYWFYFFFTKKLFNWLTTVCPKIFTVSKATMKFYHMKIYILVQVNDECCWHLHKEIPGTLTFYLNLDFIKQCYYYAWISHLTTVSHPGLHHWVYLICSSYLQCLILPPTSKPTSRYNLVSCHSLNNATQFSTRIYLWHVVENKSFRIELRIQQ